MPEQEKPYRVYKGGRAKGKVPLQRPSDGRSKKDSAEARTVGSPADGSGRWITSHCCSCWFSPSSGSSRATLRLRGIKDANGRVPAPSPPS
jgi:hypothetical protein